MANRFGDEAAQGPTGQVNRFGDSAGGNQQSDHAVRDQLKQEGFLDSAWSTLKAPFTLMGSLFNGQYKKQNEADYAHMQELETNGTPEQKREFAKEVLLKHIPFASTVYKAMQGNIPGALGDAAGIAALGGVYKAAEAAPGAVRVATDPVVVRAGLKVLPKGGAMVDLLDAVKKARGQETPAAPPPPDTPGQVFAKANGFDWAKLSAEDKANLEITAKATQSAADRYQAARAAPQPQPAPPPQPDPASAAQPVSPTQGMTAADMISAEMAAKRGSQPTAPQPLVGGHDTTPIRMRADSPLRPPLRQPAPQPVPVPPEASSAPAVAPPSPPPPAEVIPPPRTLPQVEAAMAQKSPAPINPAETRTQYLPSQQVSKSLNGEEIYDAAADRKSPQLRAAEIKGANAGEKAVRWAEALHAEGITAEDLGNMKPGDMAVMSEGMKAKGTLGPKETVPDTSLPMIRKRLKAMELQEALQAEMKKSGSIQ